MERRGDTPAARGFGSAPSAARLSHGEGRPFCYGCAVEHPIADPVAQQPPRRSTPVWLFALLQIPYGVAGAFTASTLGRILKLNHVESSKIETVIALTVLIAGVQFLWAPTVDIGLRRRSWYLLMAFTSATVLAAAMMVPLPDHVNLFIVLTLIAQLAICLTSACVGGLMVTTVADHQRGRASGFSNFGNIGVGSIAGGVSLQLLEHHSLQVVGLSVAALTALPSLIVLLIDDPPPEPRSARAIFGAMLREVWSTVKQRKGWSGILLCISPVGTAAAMQLFTSFADVYKVSDRWVTITNGYLGGLLTGTACLLGGYLCDRMNRRLAYLGAGILTAACSACMAIAPMNQTSYVIGALCYLFISGLCYAAFTAFVLEVVGPANATASTQYTLFSSAGNFAIFYAIKFEGFGREYWQSRFGVATAPRGILYADAALNLVGVVLFVCLLALLKPTVEAALATGAAKAKELPPPARAIGE